MAPVGLAAKVAEGLAAKVAVAGRADDRAGTLAVLIADVVSSAHLYERLSAERAQAVVAQCIETMRAATTEQGGTVVTTLGMSSWPPSRARRRR